MNKINKITHGIVVLDTRLPVEDVEVIHFVGFWKEPTQQDIDNLKEELRTDPTFGLSDVIDELEFLPATQKQIDFFNTLLHEEDGLKDLHDISLN